MLLRLLCLQSLLLLSLNAPSQPSVCFPKVAGDKRRFIYPQQELDTGLRLANYRAFFIGEAHVPSLIPTFRTKFIIHLNESYGVRDVFLEAGYATAWMLNQFLITGDRSEFLPEGDIYAEWKALYDYNQSIPENKRLIIHGLDFERRNVFKVLLKLRPPDKVPPPELEPFFAPLKEAASDSTLRILSKAFASAVLLHNVDTAYNRVSWPYIGIAENEDNPALFRKFVPADCRAAIVKSDYTAAKNIQRNCDWIWMADEADRGE